MFIAVLFIIVKNGEKHPNVHPVVSGYTNWIPYDGKLLNKPSDIHTHWMTLKDAMLSERSQSRKITYIIIPFRLDALKKGKPQCWRTDQWLRGAGG